MILIGQFLDAFGTYAVLVLLLLIEVLIGILLLNAYFGVRRNYKKQKRNGQYQDIYNDILTKRADRVEVLFRHEDMYPMYATENFSAFTGLTLEELQSDVMLLFSMLIDDSGRKKIQKQYRDWDGNGVFWQEFQKKGEAIWIRMEICRTVNEDYELVSFSDITKEKLAYFEMQKQLENVEKESQSKTTFLSRMSHEIRTPMGGIMGMLSLAQTHVEDPGKVKAYLGRAEDLSQHLLGLINDILDMSRIEAGKVELENKTFDIYEMGNKLSNMFRKNIEEKGVRFEIRYQDFDTRYFMGDELRIMQVIINFLSNAMKFTSEGEIVVTFRQMLRKQGMADILIRVHDTGIGMKPEFISRIFRPFEQEDMEIAKKYGGSGLGMAITDHIVRLMGGEIVVESLPNKGSDFTVFLHLPVSEEQVADRSFDKWADRTEEYSLAGRRILLAEDNEINADITISILQEVEGAVVERVVNGREAVEAFIKHEPGYYDFILMDIQMPLMDGRSATRQIRGMDRVDAKTIPIFALSADAFVEDERLSAEAGMNGHFTKPIDFDNLKKKIGLFFQGGTRR